METLKLSERAQVVLGVIREATIIDDGKLQRVWVPWGDFVYSVYGEGLRDGTIIPGPGDARIIRSLCAKGLVQMEPKLGPYACAATEDGILEYERIAEHRRSI